MIQTLKRKVRQLIWKRMRLRALLLSGVEVSVESDSDWVIYNEIFVNNEYDKAFEQLTDFKTEIIVLDLGANVGYFSLKAIDHLLGKNCSFRILAVEADRGNYTMCSDRLAPYISSGYCKVVHGLVGELKGKAAFYKDPYHFGHSVSNNLEREQNCDMIEYLNLNEYVAASKKIAIIKCDIEGSEKQFIPAYRGLLERTGIFICEFHDEASVVEQLENTLRGYGFQAGIILRSDPHYNTQVKLYSR